MLQVKLVRITRVARGSTAHHRSLRAQAGGAYAPVPLEMGTGLLIIEETSSQGKPTRRQNGPSFQVNYSAPFVKHLAPFGSPKEKRPEKFFAKRSILSGRLGAPTPTHFSESPVPTQVPLTVQSHRPPLSSCGISAPQSQASFASLADSAPIERTQK